MQRAIAAIADQLRDGQLLVLRSTVYPGVTAMVEKVPERLGRGIDVAFCPERIAEGKPMTELHELPQGSTPRPIQVPCSQCRLAPNHETRPPRSSGARSTRRTRRDPRAPPACNRARDRAAPRPRHDDPRLRVGSGEARLESAVRSDSRAAARDGATRVGAPGVWDSRPLTRARTPAAQSGAQCENGHPSARIERQRGGRNRTAAGPRRTGPAARFPSTLPRHHSGDVA